MKPTNSPTQGQPSPRKNRLKSGIWGHFFPHCKYFFSGSGLILYRKQATRNPTQPNSLVINHWTKLSVQPWDESITQASERVAGAPLPAGLPRRGHEPGWCAKLLHPSARRLPGIVYYSSSSRTIYVLMMQLPRSFVYYRCSSSSPTFSMLRCNFFEASCTTAVVMIPWHATMSLVRSFGRAREDATLRQSPCVHVLHAKVTSPRCLQNLVWWKQGHSLSTKKYNVIVS